MEYFTRLAIAVTIPPWCEIWLCERSKYFSVCDALSPRPSEASWFRLS